MGDVREDSGLVRILSKVHSRFLQDCTTTLRSPENSGSSAAQRGRCTPKVNRGKIQSGHAITWTHEHQVVLEKLVDYLVNPPFLGYPDYSLPFILHTDASNKGLGAVLYQRKSSEMRVIGYGSRTLNPAEKNYHLHSGKLQFLELK